MICILQLEIKLLSGALQQTCGIKSSGKAMEGSITSILNKVPRIVTGMESDTEIKGTDRTWKQVTGRFLQEQADFYRNRQRALCLSFQHAKSFPPFLSGSYT